MRDSIIAYNKHPGGSGSHGGGVFLYDGYEQATLRNCLVMGNTIESQGSYITRGGAGVHLAGGRVENCTIVNNHIPRTGETVTGAGILHRAGTVVNTIIAGNTIYDGEPNDFDYSNKGKNIKVIHNSRAPELDNGVDGNITADPLFVDAENGDYHLTADSPCINKGILLGWMAAASDLDGNPRVKTRMPDMGCYEYCPPMGTIFVVR